MKNILDEKGTRVAFIVVDVALITISYFLAFYIRSETYDARNWDSFFSVLPWIMLISVFFLSVFEVNPSRRKRLFDYFGSIIVSTTSITIATMAVSFFFRAFGLPRSVILLSFIIGIALLTIWKVIFLYIRKSSNPENVLIISNPQDKRRLMYQVEETFASKINLHFVDYNSPIEEIYEAIKNAESVVIGSKDTDEKKSSIIYYSFKNSKNLYLVPSFYDLLLSK
ncbi:MAG: sugar transferase, partial [Campylobacterales bacterium]|nr:sugar transferase [Campylobacterales bacterium]